MKKLYLEKKLITKELMERLKKSYHLVCSLLLVLSVATSCEQNKSSEVKKVKVNDIEIAYYTRGSGKPLVMIMGFRGTMAIWDPGLLEELEKHYTLILFDNRGVGLSTDTEKNLTTIPQMAADTIGLIKALGYEKVSLLGWSMGSRIAQVTALDHPDIVENLILCSPNPGGKYQAHRTSDAYKKLTSTSMSKEEGLSLIFPQTEQGQQASNEFVKRLTEAVIIGSVPDDLTVSPQTIERQTQALRLWDETNENYEALPKLKVPTLVAGGLADVLDQPENIHIIASKIPYAWSAYFPRAGHDFLSQDYKSFGQLVVLFIETNKR